MTNVALCGVGLMAVRQAARVLRPELGALWPALRSFGPRGWALAAAATVAGLVVLGAPTVMFDSVWFSRAVEVRTQDRVFWVISAVFLGLIAGTFAGPRGETGDGQRPALAGGLLSYLAIGCPVCNKLVLLLLGTSGALSVWAPLQLFVGIASVALLAWTLLLRAAALTRPCPSGVMIDE